MLFRVTSVVSCTSTKEQFFKQLNYTTKMSQQISAQGLLPQTWSDTTVSVSKSVSRLHPAHHVQTATVHQCSELM